MTNLIPYIAFPGTCKKALEFYAQILNGKITFMQTFKDSPMDALEDMGSRIFNAELKAPGFHIKASDDLPPHNSVTVGSNMSLFGVFSNRAAQEDVFNALADEGKILFPIEGSFGMVKDKFDIQWMLVLDNPPG